MRIERGQAALHRYVTASDGLDDAQRHALHRLDGLDELIQGRDAAQLMREHNIHLHNEDPWEAGEADDDHAVPQHEGVPVHHRPDVPLHTSQDTLYKSGLEHYIRHPYTGGGGIGPRPGEPHTWEHEGQHWIAGGHHRILADRMTHRNGVESLDVTNRRLGFSRAAAEVPPPHPNPYADLGHGLGGPEGQHWYHGTATPYEGAPQSPRWDYEGAHAENWSTDLGTHYTALRDVAKQIAIRKGTSPDSRVAHARLHMANPADYENEHELTDHAIGWARDRGLHHGRHPDPNVDEIDEFGTEDASLHQKETWLGHHPKRHAISDGFLAHLKDRGHDGIVYGNSHEGPESHKSAIAFPDTPVTVDHWEHLDPRHEEESHGRTAGKGKPRHDAPDVARRADEEDAGRPSDVAPGSGRDSVDAPLKALAEHPKVASDLRRLPQPVQLAYHDRVDDLRRGNSHSSTHALNGPLKGWQATNLNFKTRVVHRTVGDELHVLSAGNHDETYEQGIRRNAVLSDEDRVSVAEEAMERAGHTGQSWHVPAMHRDNPARVEAHRPVHEFVNGVLAEHGHPGGIQVHPRHWDLRGSDSGQATTDGLNHIGLSGEHTNDLTLLHEMAHILTGTGEGAGGHGPEFQQTAHQLYHQHLGPDAAGTFSRLTRSPVTAAYRAGDRGTCPCGIPVEYDPADGFQHLDGSISHDGDLAPYSVSDLVDLGRLPRRFDGTTITAAARKPTLLYHGTAVAGDDPEHIAPGPSGYAYASKSPLHALRHAQEAAEGSGGEPHVFEVKHAGRPADLSEHPREQHGWRSTKGFQVLRRSPLGFVPREARYTAPRERLFGRTYGLDTRIWEDERLKEPVRTDIMASFDAFCVRHGYVGHEVWSKVIFFGSEASGWTSKTLRGNNDFDLSIGLHYPRFRESNPGFRDTADDQIAAELTQQMHAELNDPQKRFPGIEGVWDETWFANLLGWDIRMIRPYAAWDVVTETWIVRPPDLPDWSMASFPEGQGLADEVHGIILMAEGILKMPEPYRTQNGSALWEFVHRNRSDAFGPQGEGWWDARNAVEKALDQKGLMQELFLCHQRAAEHPESLAAPADWSNSPAVR